MKKPDVQIYTDGACSNNPGKGGFGAILLYKNKSGEVIKKQLSRGFKCTTNNRMELMAVVEALNQLKKPCRIELYSDSKYVVNAINKNWLKNWEMKDWKSSQNGRVKNIDLWKKYILASKDHDIKYIWVKGHNENMYNELCDKLAVNARTSPNLEIDEGYKLQHSS